MQREKLGSRLGFILISAGCAIGCGNVWKFPWMVGQNGGGIFVLIYLLCLIILGVPCMIMEFSLGRASRLSPVNMYQKLEKPGHKWHIHGYVSLFANFCLMFFYTTVNGWMLYYLYKFLIGENKSLSFSSMITNPTVCVVFMVIIVAVAFILLCFKLQTGLEKVSKYMMIAMFILLIGLAIYSCTLKNAGKGLLFYLIPDTKPIKEQGLLSIIVSAMNQSFFTLSVGIGSMAIFGSYIDKDRSLAGESIRIVALDTFVAITAGLIIFPACFTFNGGQVGAGPGLLFDTMASVFNKMNYGRWIGTLFFLFMVFAAFSTTLTVCENIVACIREIITDAKNKRAVKKGQEASDKLVGRPICCLIAFAVVVIFSLTTALGYSVFSGFVPFAEGTAWLDVWDFIVSTNLLPLGSLVITLFCCFKFGWGWDNFIKEANIGKGLKIRNWMKPIFSYVIPIIIITIYIYGIINFAWK